MQDNTTVRKRKKKAASSAPDEVRAYFEKHGLSTEHLDAGAVSITDAVIGGDNPFAFIGEDAKPSMFRYARVETDREIGSLKQKHYVLIADWRNGRPKMDVRMRGAAGGVIMGRLLDHDKAYQAARIKRAHEKKYGRQASQKSISSRGGRGRLETQTEYEAVRVSGARE